MALPPAGVYRGPCGVWTQNMSNATALNPGASKQQTGITAYAAWLGQPVTYVLDYMTDAPTSWGGSSGRVRHQPAGAVTGYTALSPGAAWAAGPCACRFRRVPASQPALVPPPGRRRRRAPTTRTGRRSAPTWSPGATQPRCCVSAGSSTAPGTTGRPSVTGDTPASYIAGYQHIVTKLKAVAGSSFKFMWNPAFSPTMGGQGARQRELRRAAVVPRRLLRGRHRPGHLRLGKELSHPAGGPVG